MISIFSISVAFSQDTIINKNIDLPKYYIIGKDTAGVILSIQQAQEVDNSLDLLNLLENDKTSCDSTIAHYVLLYNDAQINIKTLGEDILQKDTAIQIKEEKIVVLSKTNDNLVSDLSKSDKQSRLKDKIISNQSRSISWLKIERVGISVVGVVTAGFAYLFGSHLL
jgi:hypothetical protein